MERRTQLQADCANCFALCCTALRFYVSADFAIDKPAGVPCPNLAPDLRCTIHADLRERGFGGCAAYDCQGAGQKVSQVTFGGRDWRSDPQAGRWYVVVYPVVRQLHEMLALLDEAAEVPAAAPLRDEVEAAFGAIEQLTYLPPDELVRVDVAARRAATVALLDQVSALARRPAPAGSHRDADLAGARLRGADLRNAQLRNACLIRADLREADLRGADLLGADLRDADLRGADLRECLFLTQAQLAGAAGDASTRIPARLAQPVHWRTRRGRER